MTERGAEPEDVSSLLVAFAPRVYGLLLRMVGRPEVAEDLMQEAMMRAYRNRETYRAEGRFKAWIFRIAVNLARDWVRRRGRNPVTESDDPDAAAAGAVADDPPPDALAMGRERARRVEAAMARLPQADREVLLLRYYGGLAFKDIAESGGEPIGTVLARAHRALKKLGDLIPEEEP
jgi:RNA polymerase sigma-70 factor (ECF subfamily)